MTPYKFSIGQEVTYKGEDGTICHRFKNEGKLMEIAPYSLNCYNVHYDNTNDVAIAIPESMIDPKRQLPLGI